MVFRPLFHRTLIIAELNVTVWSLGVSLSATRFCLPRTVGNLRTVAKTANVIDRAPQQLCTFVLVFYYAARGENQFASDLLRRHEMESGNCDPLSAAKLQLIAINSYRRRSAAPFCGLIVIGGGRRETLRRTILARIGLTAKMCYRYLTIMIYRTLVLPREKRGHEIYETILVKDLNCDLREVAWENYWRKYELLFRFVSNKVTVFEESAEVNFLHKGNKTLLYRMCCKQHSNLRTMFRIKNISQIENVWIILVNITTKMNIHTNYLMLKKRSSKNLPLSFILRKILHLRITLLNLTLYWKGICMFLIRFNF